MPVQHSPPNRVTPCSPTDDQSDPSDEAQSFNTPTNRNRDSILPTDFEMTDDDDLLQVNLDQLCLSNISNTSTTTVQKTDVQKMAKSNDDKTNVKAEMVDKADESGLTIGQLTCARADIDKYVRCIEKLESDSSNVVRWKQCTSKAIYHMMGVPLYWEGEKPDQDSAFEMAIDQCALCVIEEMIPDDISDLIRLIILAQDAMTLIKDQFCQGG
ncbi:hypothetical protein CROQUDRAFT_694583 [Cronartium quercuum f. sp. fusiforme G11]|uniref:Uncharacterized protein n=1 Tax=Cronartium quercuum f. sp. fusiforme G11 TaxID=708437 RepID=A0A9P6N8R8_9BASI|nr:hypothetical protein CROQUDRAFT_694583 [Cronartium quercuum f. sp. fusiforme G11]